MSGIQIEMKEFHWLVAMVHNIDVGLVVLDREHRVMVWNGFMENHSGMTPHDVRGKNLFELFPQLPKAWLKQKLDSVVLLKNRAFTTWEQRQYIFPFANYRPITSTTEYMYQNMTIFPLTSLTGEVDHLALILYDVTDVAVNRDELKKANEKLKQLSRTDGLTKLNNRTTWEEAMVHEFARYQRTHHVSSLVMFDIDHFKKINDQYGHRAGDEVIRTLSKLLVKTKRTTDIAGRYGGEEFAVILPDTEAVQARYFAERLRKVVEQNPVIFENQTICYTISLGIAQTTTTLVTHQSWLEEADKALYASKHNGRNQVTISE